METLLEALLSLCGSLDPATRAEILAAVGAVSLVMIFLALITAAGRLAGEGIGHIATGLAALVRSALRLLAALAMLWVSYCLINGTIVHIQH